MVAQLNAPVDNKSVIIDILDQGKGKSSVDNGPKPVKVKSFYDSKDVSLAISNAGTLAIQSAYIAYPAYRLALFVPLFLAGLWQSIKVYQSIPKSAPINKALSHPIIPFFAGLFPNVGRIYSLASLIGVARNSIPKLYTCFKDGSKRPYEALTGTALHVFNLGSQGYLTKTSFEAYDEFEKMHENFKNEWKRFEDDFRKNGSKFEDGHYSYSWGWESNGSNFGGDGGGGGGLGCSTKPESHFEKMTTLERLKSPDLNPKCPSDAKIMLGVKFDKACEDAVASGAWAATIAEKCKGAGQAIQKAFLSASKVGHPDKGGTDEAFRNADDARHTLNEIYNKKPPSEG